MYGAKTWIVKLLLAASCLASLTPAVAQEVLKVDLAPLIEEAARNRTQFAVDVPYRISTSTHGEWTSRGAVREWTYSVQIPTAVSMSFYALPVQLPPSAQITVSGVEASATYRTSDVPRGSLWGRPLLGDTLKFKLSVSAAEAPQAQFEIVSLQAGYRSLSPAVPDHPYYRRLPSAKAAQAVTPSCVQNYVCNSTEANRGPAKATVALLIGNTGQCTGTLVNNVRGDARPYVLTARHCQNGELGGGAPNAAASVTVYWDAVSACGELLGSLYSGSVTAQTGARTVLEQQDAWLIELDRKPAIPDAYFAGWDATGGAFVGGYSIHHAMGGDQQFVSWYGQSILHRVPGRVLSVSYDSDFWGVVNSFGNVGPGASGGALFNPENRVVASASLAYLIDGEGSYGVCPAGSPPAPTLATITAQYTALSAIWNSVGDTTSSTGSTTLKGTLDPDGTGRMTLEGMGFMPVQLTASNSNARTDQPITLSWNVQWAQSCTATGGRPGDSWAGSRPPTGTATIAEVAGGTVEYGLNCTGGDRSGYGSKSVDWLFIQPSISMLGPSTPVMVGAPFELRWSTDLQPCTASGGVSGDGWAGAKSQSGNQTVQTTQLGTKTYSISCGTGGRIATRQLTVDVVVPSITLFADATSLRAGSEFNLWWRSDAQGVCSGSGGVPTWAPNTQSVQSRGSAVSRSSMPGTITYTMTCSGGGLSASSSVTVEFVDEVPISSLAAVAATQMIFDRENIPANPPPNLTWTSNQSFCTLSSLGPVTNSRVDLDGKYPAGTATAMEFIAGTYEYSLNCPLVPSARATIQWIAAHPRVWLSDEGIPTEDPPSSKTWVGGYQYQLYWTSNTLPCTASGGVQGDGWAGAKGNSAQATQIVSAPTVPGTYTYSLTCGTGVSVDSTNFVVTVPPPAVTLTSTPASPAAGQFVTLHWNSTVSPCTANADAQGVDWGSSGMLNEGQLINRQMAAGSYRYTISCGNGAQLVTASTQVVFRTGAATEFSASATTVPVGTPVRLSWQSGSTSCNAIGGLEGDSWFGTKPTSGSMTVTSPIAQTVGYALNCSAGGASILVTYTGDVTNESPSAPRPSATLSANRSTQVAGQPVTLTWGATNSNACFAAGGSPGDGWAGSLSLSGTMAVTRSTSGSATYSITCTGAVPASTAQAAVTFSDAPGVSGNNSGTGGGGGGGGAFDGYSLLAFLLAAMARLVHMRFACFSKPFIESRLKRGAGNANLQRQRSFRATD